MSHMRSLLCATVSLGALLACSPTLAQTSAGEEIAEVVVTAQKRAESLQDVPMSVTAVTAAQIESRHIYDPSQLQYIAPSLQMKSFNASAGATNFAVRGVGTLSFANSIDASVTSVIDGVVMGRPEMGLMNFLDLQQVEVLNGPQGMLFGKNASAGLVNITTKRPVLGSYEGLARVEAGRLASPGHPTQALAQGVLNIPIGEQAAFRISGSYTHSPALVKNLVEAPGSKFGQDQYAVRGKFYVAPSDAMNIMLAADYARSSGISGGIGADRIVTPGSPYDADDQAFGIAPGPKNALATYGARTNQSFKVGGAQLNVDYTFGSGLMLTNILAFRFLDGRNNFDSDKHRIDLADTNAQSQSQTQVTDELRLTSPAGRRFDYQVGVYYYRGDIDMNLRLLGALGMPGAPPPPFTAWVGASLVGSLKSTSYAAFGQGTFNVTDDLRLVVGARFTRDELSADTTVGDGGAFIPLFGTPGSARFQQALEQKNVSWRVAGQYDVSDDVMAYATVARGYKAPGFNLTFNPTTPQIKPEYPTLYEAGLKSTWLDRRLILNASVYYETFEDFQAQAFDTLSTSYILLNAGELISKGAELQATALPLEGLTLNLGVSYVDAYFKSYDGDLCYAGQPGCSPGGTIDSSGNRLPNAPKWTASLSGEYSRPVTSALTGSVQGALYYRGQSNFRSNGDPKTVQPAYTVFDGSLSLADTDGRWKASLFCRNCFDKRHTTFIDASEISQAEYFHMFGLNSFRTIGVSLEARF